MSCLPPYVSLIARDGPLKLTSQQSSRKPTCYEKSLRPVGSACLAGQDTRGSGVAVHEISCVSVVS